MWAKSVCLNHSKPRAAIFCTYLYKNSEITRMVTTLKDSNLNNRISLNEIEDLGAVMHKNPNINKDIKFTQSSYSKIRNSTISNNHVNELRRSNSEVSSNSSSVKVLQDTMKMKELQNFNKMLFEMPKQTIHNFFDNLVNKFGYNDLKVSPVLQMLTFQNGITLWKCEYKIKWPQEKVFPYVHFSKKEAMNGSALDVVMYLYNRQVISLKGTPLLQNKNILSNLTNRMSRVRLYCTKSPGEFNSLSDTVGDKPPSKNVVESLAWSNLFPNPKNVLGNIFQVVSNEKGKNQIWLSSSFKNSGKQWICTYKLKWPEELNFTATASTKQKASQKCSLEALKYLLQHQKITKKGAPILYDREDIKALVKSNLPVLHFQEKQIDKMKKIIDLHEQEISSILLDQKSTSDNNELKNEKVTHTKNIYLQRFLGAHKYECLEKNVLPVSEYKEDIIRLLQENRVLIVKGEPGCGKSTRIPQYILEGWSREAGETREPCNIIVTEPRRIAAISLANRVASERNEEVGTIVGYQVRLKTNFQPRTGRIMYCTNGILLQNFKSDPTLSKYTHVVIDEAHERDINTDLLLNMLRKVLDENPDLKVVIMSATIDTDLFQKYFEGSALMHIPGFTYPVKSYFIDNCKLNLDKTIKMCNESEPSVIHEDVVKVLMHLHSKKPEGAMLCFLPGWEDIRKIRDMIPDREDINVLCLHSRLQDKEQWKIFSSSPPGVRKIILSTNIAETSVTVSDVVYVIDTGIHKETMLDAEKGVMCIDNHWISRSSVDQRKGRAGRVRPGECYHLYPKSLLETFSKFSLPEVLRVSLTKVVLDSKVYSQDTSALEFFSRLPTPPSEDNVQLAVDELKELELMDDNEKLTPLGEIVANFQLEPKLSKTVVNSVIYKCVTPIVDIATLFSSGTEIFASSLDNKENIRKLKQNFSKTSDHLSIMKIFEIWDEFREHGSSNKMEKFCADLHLVPTRISTIKSLRNLHFDYLRDSLMCSVLPISDDFSDEDEIVKAVLLSGVGTFLTHKNWEIANGRMKKGNVFLTKLNHKATVTPDSVNFKNISLKSKYLLYINETRSNLRRTTLIRETSCIPAVMVVLFSNKNLRIIDISEKEFSAEVKSEDQVMLNLLGTKLSFILDRQQAVTIMQCKKALTSCYNYYIFQLTKGGKHNPELNQLWDEVLYILSDFLNDFKNS